MAAWPYNTAGWARLRRVKLDEQPDCEPCRDAGVLTLANTVDHAVPINAGGEPFPATTGLTSMCGPCHGAKTARGVEAGAIRSTKPRKGCDADGNPLDPNHPWADAAKHDREVRRGTVHSSHIRSGDCASGISACRNCSGGGCHLVDDPDGSSQPSQVGVRLNKSLRAGALGPTPGRETQLVSDREGSDG